MADDQKKLDETLKKTDEAKKAADQLLKDAYKIHSQAKNLMSGKAVSVETIPKNLWLQRSLAPAMQELKWMSRMWNKAFDSKVLGPMAKGMSAAGELQVHEGIKGAFQEVSSHIKSLADQLLGDLMPYISSAVNIAKGITKSLWQSGVWIAAMGKVINAWRKNRKDKRGKDESGDFSGLSDTLIKGKEEEKKKRTRKEGKVKDETGWLSLGSVVQEDVKERKKDRKKPTPKSIGPSLVDIEKDKAKAGLRIAKSGEDSIFTKILDLALPFLMAATSFFSGTWAPALGVALTAAIAAGIIAYVNGKNPFSMNVPKEPSGTGIISGSNIQGWSQEATQAYLDTTRKQESGKKGYSNDDSKVGMIGGYQMDPGSLAMTGDINSTKHRQERAKYTSKEWYQGGMAKKFGDDPSNWNTEGGKQSFLADPKRQDEQMIRYTNANANSVRKKLAGQGIDFDSLPLEKKAGYIAAAHLTGPGHADEISKGIDSKDANKTSALGRFHAMENVMKNINEFGDSKENIRPKPGPATMTPEELAAKDAKNRAADAVPALNAAEKEKKLQEQKMLEFMGGKGVKVEPTVTSKDGPVTVSTQTGGGSSGRDNSTFFNAIDLWMERTLFRIMP